MDLDRFLPDTKLVPTWRVGDRTVETAVDFLADLESRLADRIQLTSDGYSAYLEAVASAFGDEVDYAMLSKAASREELEIRKQIISGDPDGRLHLNFFDRAAELDSEDVFTSVHSEDKRFLEEDGESRTCGGLALSALQLSFGFIRRSG